MWCQWTVSLSSFSDCAATLDRSLASLSGRSSFADDRQPLLSTPGLFLFTVTVSTTSTGAIQEMQKYWRAFKLVILVVPAPTKILAVLNLAILWPEIMQTARIQKYRRFLIWQFFRQPPIFLHLQYAIL